MDEELCVEGCTRLVVQMVRNGIKDCNRSGKTGQRAWSWLHSRDAVYWLSLLGDRYGGVVEEIKDRVEGGGVDVPRQRSFDLEGQVI